MENKLSMNSFYFKIPNNINFLIKNNTLYLKNNKLIKQFLIKNGILSVSQNHFCISISKDLRDSRTIIDFSNFLKGISKGFFELITLNGIGYRFLRLNKESLTIKIGYNKPISLEIPNGITITILNRTSILIYSSDIKSLRNFLIKLRSIRKPDIYKAKGIQYFKEEFKCKEIKKTI